LGEGLHEAYKPARRNLPLFRVHLEFGGHHCSPNPFPAWDDFMASQQPIADGSSQEDYPCHFSDDVAEMTVCSSDDR